MTDRSWASVWKLYSELRGLPASGRAAALAASNLPPDVLTEVEALLEQSSGVSSGGSGAPPGAAAATPEPEYEPGTEFGRYVITGIAGQGGYGRVYSAHDKNLRRSVAIKIFLSSGLSSNSEGLAGEARAASALNHPNILTIHETIEIDGHPAIVMEFVNGCPLRQELTAPLALETVIRYGVQIAQALDTAHAAGIVHRDVKPENILVRPDGYLKLVDFGLAAAAASPQQDVADAWQPFNGTLRYTSPEQLRGGTFTAASDIFSFGLVLYEMAAGIHPFRQETPLATAGSIAGHATDPPLRRNPAIPERLDKLIRAMLSKDAARRPTAKQVAEELARQSAAAGGRTFFGFGFGKAGKTIGLLLAAAAGIVAALGLWLNLGRSPAVPLELRLKTTPLTGNQGRERRPAISSDGRFVVFEWQERLEEPEKTLVREIGGPDHATVLPIKGPFIWVPGTDRIAYRRKTAHGATLFTISRQGGAEEEVFTVSNITDAAWSPDGKYIAYILWREKNDTRLFLYTIATKQHKQLVSPPAQGEVALAISPDGRQIAVRSGVADSGVFISAFPEPKQWRAVLAAETEGESLTWIRDGTGLITSGFKGSNNSLWLHPLRSPGGSPTRLTSVGVEAFQVQTAIDRNRLVWLHSVDDTNIWRMPASGGGRAVRVVASLFRDSDVSVAATGAIAFRSDRSGYPEIWVGDRNGERQKRVTAIEGFTGSPRWSADGRRLAFDSRKTGGKPDIWVAECGGRTCSVKSRSGSPIMPRRMPCRTGPAMAGISISRPAGPDPGSCGKSTRRWRVIPRLRLSLCKSRQREATSQWNRRTATGCIIHAWIPLA